MLLGLRRTVIAVVVLGLAVGLTACAKHQAGDPYATSPYGSKAPSN